SLIELHALRIFSLVTIDEDVALVVVAFAYQPTEDSRGVGGIDNPAFGGLTVPSGDVVFGERSPEGLARLVYIRPPFDPGEETFDTGTVTPNVVGSVINRSVVFVND